MNLSTITIESIKVKPYDFLENNWLLLTAGDFSKGDYNAMTVSWGSLGSLWGHAIVQVFVRPTRYTYQFIDLYDTFTLCAFPPAHRKALSLLGSRSGRDSNKIALSGLTPIPASTVAAPAYAEADLVIECHKLYWDDFDPEHFLDPAIENHYPTKDYHRIYIGQIIAIHGSDAYIG